MNNIKECLLCSAADNYPICNACKKNPFFIEQARQILAQKNKLKIYGIDISPKGIKLLSERFQGEFKVGTVYKIPYPDKYFDAIFTLELLEHITPHKVMNVYKELRRVLKDGGSLILSVPLNE